MNIRKQGAGKIPPVHREREGGEVIQAKDLNKEHLVVPPKQSDFEGQQLDLFRSFLCNGGLFCIKVRNAP